jgi:hypothetical protein
MARRKELADSTAMPLKPWVKPGKAQSEHILSALPPIATNQRTSFGSFCANNESAAL